jgi:diguanylate cyclase (GGDEF)-like protein
MNDRIRLASAAPPAPLALDTRLQAGRWPAWRLQAAMNEAVDDIAGLGRWWLERGNARLSLSPVALRIFDVQPGATIDQLCARVALEDMERVGAAFAAIVAAAEPVTCEFRVVEAGQGLRWLRLQSAPSPDPGIAAGLLTDITSAKHAAMRERFNFALTQYLIGTDTFDEAVNKIIHLVCDDLGWDWGAFWALERREGAGDVLRCRHVWHAQDRDCAAFRASTAQLAVEPGQGPEGQVWRSGQSQWVDAGEPRSDAPRLASARACGLQSGYFFPVTYIAADGRLHSAGVLEFFSAAPRQREAQLPGLAESISALIAQTAQRLVQQERVRILAQTDEMTGLVNRAHFHQLIDAACAGSGAGRGFGLLYIDLDHFKPINDALGHAAGNSVLCDFADRLRALAPEGAVAARLGGDEFALLTAPGAAGAPLEALAQQVLQAACTRFNYLGHELSVSASIGVSRFPEHGTDTAQLLHAADAAMYNSKRGGRNTFCVYSGEADVQQGVLVRQLTLLSELHEARARNEFFLEYQPIFDLQGERVLAAEALIRWRKQDGTVVPPDQFIPVAEQSRMIVHLGRWVLEQVCRDLPQMHAAGLHGLQVHINMAAPEFLDLDLPGELAAIVAAARIDPRHLCLELTEGVVMNNIERSLPIMAELSRLGFEISLDDFGMGYSSLSMLKLLPIRSLKIDRLFLQGVPRGRDDCAIVRTVLDLGRNMRLRVIAEGIENDAQLGFLRQFGCSAVQGYLLGRPVPLDALVAQHGAQA